jgi:O-antigen/teichoic acid export membrane protein
MRLPMIENRRLVRNSIALVVSGGYTIAASIAFVPLMTRYLGPDGYGLYSEVYSFVMLFSVLGVFGTNAILIREAARDKENAPLLFGQALLLRLAMNVVFLGVLAVAAALYSFPREVYLLLLLCSLESVVRSIANTVVAMFRAFEVMQYELLITVVDRTIWVLGILVVVVADLGLVAVFGVFLASAFVELVLALGFCLRRVTRPHAGGHGGLWKTLLREAWPIGTAQGLRLAYERVGIVQLAAAVEPGLVGLFSGVKRIFRLTYTLFASISAALYPAMSTVAGAKRQRLQRLVSLGLRSLLMVSLPVAIFYLLFAPWFIPWFMGAEFRDAAIALQIMAPAVVLATVSALFSDLLRARGRQRYDLFCIVTALVVNLVLNALLIPRLGHVGPALSVLLSYTLQTVLALAGALPLVGRLPAKPLFAALLAAGSMVGIWWLGGPLPLWARLALMPLGYGLVLFLLGGIDRDSLHLLARIVGWRSSPPSLEEDAP